MILFSCGFLPALSVSGMTCCLVLFDFFFFPRKPCSAPHSTGISFEARISTWFLRLRWAGGLHPISETYLCLEIQA